VKWEETPHGKRWTKEYHKKWYLENKENFLKQQKEYLSNPINKKRKNTQDRQRAQKYKKQLYGLLGGAKCKRCGYSKDVRALQIDHINNDGHLERSTMRGQAVKYWKYYQNHPKEAKLRLQILCANCNQIKKFENYEGVS